MIFLLKKLERRQYNQELLQVLLMGHIFSFYQEVHLHVRMLGMKYYFINFEESTHAEFKRNPHHPDNVATVTMSPPFRQKPAAYKKYQATQKAVIAFKEAFT